MGDDKRIFKIEKVNNVTARILTNHPTIMSDVYKYFGVYIDKYWFHPKVKLGIWDGKIHFVNKDGTFPIGLLKYVYKFVKRDDLRVLIDKDLKLKNEDVEEDFAEVTEDWIGEGWVPRPHQAAGAKAALKHRRCIIEHATSSGKSLTMAMIIMYSLMKEQASKALVLVPNLSLIEQLEADFLDYGVPPEWIGKFSGKVKDIDEPIIISTWQSMHKQKAMIRTFDLLLADECLHPDSLITMGDGSKKKIIDIKVGDIVKTINEETRDIENKPVKKLHHNISSPENNMYELELENGNIVRITGNHKVMLTDGSWKKVEDLDGSEDLEVQELKGVINK